MVEKGFRKGKSKLAILKELLSKEEYSRLKEQRALDDLKPGTISYRVALENDTVRRQRDELYEQVYNKVADIKNVRSRYNKLKIQIEKGLITDELRPGMTMTKEEVLFEVYKSDKLGWGLSKDLMPIFATLRAIVGSHDLVGNELLPEKTYDSFVLETEGEVAKSGYKIFELAK